MKLGMQVGLDLPTLCQMRTQLPLTKRGTAPQFSAHTCCCQMAEWIKRPFGMEVGLGPGDFVLDGDPAPPRKKGTALNDPIFGPCLLWPNGWMDEDATWYGSRPQPRPHSVRRRPSFPSAKGHSRPPLFSAHVYCGHGRRSQLLLSSLYIGSAAHASNRIPSIKAFTVQPL